MRYSITLVLLGACIQHANTSRAVLGANGSMIDLERGVADSAREVVDRMARRGIALVEQRKTERGFVLRFKSTPIVKVLPSSERLTAVTSEYVALIDRVDDQRSHVTLEGAVEGGCRLTDRGYEVSPCQRSLLGRDVIFDGHSEGEIVRGVFGELAVMGMVVGN